MAIITPDPDKIQIIPPPKGIVGHVNMWWKSSWRGKIGVTSAGLELARRIYEGIVWLLDLPGRSDQAMNWAHDLANALKHVPHISNWVDVGLIASAFSFLLWDNRRRHNALLTSGSVLPLPKSVAEPEVTTAPEIILEYHWRNSNDTGHPDPIRMPLQFRNTGKETAINVELEIRYQKWIAKFPTIPHLAPSESKASVVNLDYDGYNLKELSADKQFISVIKPPGDDALKESRVVPAVVKYRDIRGNSYASEYEFRWDHEKEEANAYLLRYGQKATQNPQPTPDVPDVFLEWALPNPEFPGISSEKEVIVVNRSTTDFAYNILIAPLTLATTLKFGKINELKPQGRIPVEITIEGMKDPHYKPFIRFFMITENYEMAEQRGYITKKPAGLAEYVFSIPLSMTYSSRTGTCTVEIILHFDSFNGAKFELVRRGAIGA